MFGWLAAALFLVAFVLYWAGKGTVPLNDTGFTILGLLALAIHLAPQGPRYPWR